METTEKIWGQFKKWRFTKLLGTRRADERWGTGNWKRQNNKGGVAGDKGGIEYLFRRYYLLEVRGSGY